MEHNVRKGNTLKILWFNLQVDRTRQGLAFAIDWLNTVADQVERIDVITMKAGEYQVRENVDVYSVGKEKGYSEPRRAVEFYRILWNLVSQYEYDACFAHMMPLFAVMAAPLLRFKDVPIVLWYTHKSVTCILRAATMWASRVVTASPESFRIKSQKVRIIGHGIDTNRFVPKKKEPDTTRPFTLLTVGRLSQSKRIEMLLEAVKRFHQQHPDRSVYLKIAGGPLTEADQVYAAELKQIARQQQLQEMVTFEGSVSFQEVVSCYQEADCFLSLSATGSLDKVVLEAMSCGIPVIVPPTYANVLGPELATHWVVDWDAGQLCRHIESVMDLEEAERERLGRQLREIVARDHALPEVCANIVAQLKEVAYA